MSISPSQILRLWGKGYTNREDILLEPTNRILGIRRFLVALEHPQPRCGCTKTISHTQPARPCPNPTKYPHPKDPYGEPKRADEGSVLCYCCQWCRSRPECEGR